MNKYNRAIKLNLFTRPPNEAIAYVKSKNLPKKYEQVLIAMDIERLSAWETADKFNLGYWTVLNYHKKALSLISAEIENPTT